ncbi:MAG: transcriptional regulator [Alphaproteobacteria bacterium]|nr:transcriptional regulator [Alphaproteobacteria bacterium]
MTELEQQNTEFKSSWHDDYLKWICGFANAQGGKIFIGLNDIGEVVGISNHQELMEMIPQKIHDLLGILAEVNLEESEGKYFIEIVVPPYSVPISLRGRYYYRSGSTKMEFKGPALHDFLLRKSGKTWDDVLEPRAGFDDINEKTVATFLKASRQAGRLPDDDSLSLPELFDKLRLTDNGQLKRAAIILFGKDPKKYYPGAFVKIGRFGNDDADLKFQETEEGNLIELLQAAINHLNHKFFIRPIEFEGIHRIEKSEYPVPAIREMILNALVHRDYMGAPVQIRVYDNKINIWNEGLLPEGMTIEALKRSHSSRPRNPIIADVSFKGGYIDSWGRGTIKILDACKESGLPVPEMQEQDGGFIITLYKNLFVEEQLVKQGLNDRQLKAVQFVLEKGKISNSDFQLINSVSKATASRDLSELVEKFNLFIKQGLTGVGTIYILKK